MAGRPRLLRLMRDNWWERGQPIRLPPRGRGVLFTLRRRWDSARPERREHSAAYALRRDPLPNELATFDELFVSIRNEQPANGLTALAQGLADARAA
jgi:hypothetical protein